MESDLEAYVRRGGGAHSVNAGSLLLTRCWRPNELACFIPVFTRILPEAAQKENDWSVFSVYYCYEQSDA